MIPGSDSLFGLRQRLSGELEVYCHQSGGDHAAHPATALVEIEWEPGNARGVFDREEFYACTDIERRLQWLQPALLTRRIPTTPSGPISPSV